MIVLWMPRHQASKVCTHLSMASFAAFFPCSTKFAYCKRWLNTAKTWQRGYKSASFVERYSFLHCPARLNEAQSDDAVHCGSLFRIQGGPLHGDSWIIQASSPCNGPPSTLVLELRAPMGVCSGQYGICTATVILHAQCTTLPMPLNEWWYKQGRQKWGMQWGCKVFDSKLNTSGS